MQSLYIIGEKIFCKIKAEFPSIGTQYIHLHFFKK